MMLFQDGKIINNYKSCLYKEVYRSAHEPVFVKLLEMAPGELIAINIMWMTTENGKKVKETGVLDVHDRDAIDAMLANKDLEEMLGYVKIVAYSEIFKLDFTKFANYCYKTINSEPGK